MKRLMIILFCLILFLAMGGVACADNLVVNGKFEAIYINWDGSQILIPSWDEWGISPANQGSNYGFWDVVGYGGPTQYGVYFAGPGPDYDAIGQAIPTVPGTPYTFSFCLARLDTSTRYPDLPSEFYALWNGTPVLSINSADAFAWTYYTFNVIATGSSSLIGFAGTALSSGAGYEFTDIQVSLAEPAPIPGTAALLSSGLLFLVGWRRLRKH